MLLQAIGAGLPAALAIALSPFPVIAIVLVLTGAHGRLGGPFFAVGWLVGLSAITVLTVVVFNGSDDPESTAATVAAWLRVVAGAALVVMGVRKWRARPRRGEVADPPRWMASLDEVTPPRSLLLGLGLGGANPKNLVLSAAATTSIIESGVHGTQLLVAIAVFVLLGSITVLGAVVAHLFGGRRGAAALAGVDEFMAANSTAVTVVIIVLIGAKVLGDGLAGLG